MIVRNAVCVTGVSLFAAERAKKLTHFLLNLLKTKCDPTSICSTLLADTIHAYRNGDAMSLTDCKFIELPKIHDVRGNLTFVEGTRHVPFEFKRVYYLYDVPGGSDRGGHAHRKLSQFIISMSGSFDVVLNDGDRSRRYHLNRSYYGLYICPMIWRTIDNFSSNAVCMVLASLFFDERDYIRDFDSFAEIAKSGLPE